MAESIIIVVLALLGLIGHFLKKLVEVKNATGQTLSINEYYVGNKLTSLSAVVFCLALLLLMWGSDELTKTNAFLIGYASESMVAALMKRKFSNV